MNSILPPNSRLKSQVCGGEFIKLVSSTVRNPGCTNPAAMLQGHSWLHSFRDSARQQTGCDSIMLSWESIKASVNLTGAFCCIQTNGLV